MTSDHRRDQAISPDRRVRLAVAAVTGVVERHVAHERSTRRECLAAITVEVGGLPGPLRAEALAHAAASFVAPQHPALAPMVEAAREVLAEAGADLERAGRIARLRAQTRRLRIGPDAEL